MGIMGKTAGRENCGQAKSKRRQQKQGKTLFGLGLCLARGLAPRRSGRSRLGDYFAKACGKRHRRGRARNHRQSRFVQPFSRYALRVAAGLKAAIHRDFGRPRGRVLAQAQFHREAGFAFVRLGFGIEVGVESPLGLCLEKPRAFHNRARELERGRNARGRGSRVQMPTRVDARRDARQRLPSRSGCRGIERDRPVRVLNRLGRGREARQEKGQSRQIRREPFRHNPPQ